MYGPHLDQSVLSETVHHWSWYVSCLPAAKGDIKVWRTELTTSVVDYLGYVANQTEQFVKQCDDGSWCCESFDPPLDLNVLNSTMQSQVDACCSRGSGVFINNGKVTNVNPSGTATSASVTPTTTQSPSSPTRTPPPHPRTPTGAIAGGVVGGVAGLVLIVVATFYCRRMKRKPDSMPEDSAGQEMLEAWKLHEKHGNERFETDGTQEKLHEKHGNERFETDGTQVGHGPYEL